jgi:hypothetical protein
MHMFVCNGKNTRKYHNIKICNTSLEKLEDLKYLVKALINRNSIHDKIEIV